MIRVRISSCAAALAFAGVLTPPGMAGERTPPTAVPIPPSYELIWSDEFDRPDQFPGARWNAASYNVSDNWAYESDLSRVAEGRLRIEARSDRAGRVRAGRVNTQGRFAHGPAYYEVRARVDSTPGVRAVVRLMSSEMGRHVDNPGEGGADVQLLRLEPSPRRIFQGVYWNPYAGTIMAEDQLPEGWMDTDLGRPLEALGSETHKVEITRDPRSAGGLVDPAWFHDADPAGDGFHVYSLLWTGDGYRFFVDGRLTHVIREGVSGVPLFLEAWIEGHIQQGRTARMAAMELDYVRVFAPPSRVADEAKRPAVAPAPGNQGSLILPAGPSASSPNIEPPLTSPALELTPESESKP